MRYITLFKVHVLHEYFHDQRFDIKIVPTQETSKLLQQEQLVFKQSNSFIELLIKEGTHIDEDIFSFYVFPTSTLIRTITELDDDSILIFSNRTSKTEILESNSKKENLYIKDKKVIAVIDVNTNNLSKVNYTFKANFPTKAYKWMYYFISKSDSSVLKIIPKDTALSFEEKENFEDSKVLALQSNYPTATIKVFESNQLIPLREKPISDIKLLMNEELLVSHLPNPKLDASGVHILKIM